MIIAFFTIIGTSEIESALVQCKEVSTPIIYIKLKFSLKKKIKLIHGSMMMQGVRGGGGRVSP